MRYILFLFISTISFAQQIQKVDFIKLNASVVPNVVEKTISGEIHYTFTVLSTIDTIKIDAQKMDFSSVKINNKEVDFKNSGKQLLLFEGFKKGKNTLSFSYKAKPKQTLYFIGENENLQIWTQGQGKYTSHWLPSFDDVNEKVIFNLSIDFNKNYKVISNGKLKKLISRKQTITWNYEMKQPMSSYLVMLAIGNFEKQESKSKSGTTLEFYMDKSDLSKMEPTYRYSKPIFDFLEQEIGIKYPWEIYRQIPIRDFLYAGMENTTSTLFSQDFVVDSVGFNDRNYINVNAHELAHQWFGNLITAQTGKHHWLQEGFATYYALLAEKEVFGDDYFYNELYNNALELKNATASDTIPIMNEKASSLTFYKKGAWTLHVLREDIGAENFKKAVKNYLKKYQFKNVVTDDFLLEVKKVALNYDIQSFKTKWLETAGFDMDVAEKYLSKNKATAEYIFLSKNKRDLDFYKSVLLSNAYFPVKQYIFYKIAEIPFQEKKELLAIGLKQNFLVRQAIAETVTTIPMEFKSDYETFLTDTSYKTKEIALLHLCLNFPENAMQYLEKTRNIMGNNDKSFRILWLTLSLKFNSDKEQKNLFYKELIQYTNANYESSIRQNALETVIELEIINQNILKELVNATTHHKWQFSKFGRETIRLLLKKEGLRIQFLELKPRLNDKEIRSLEKLLTE